MKKIRGCNCILFVFTLVLSVIGRSVGGEEAMSLSVEEKPSYIPIQGFSGPRLSDMVIDPEGAIWALANGKVYCCDDTEFQETSNQALKSGQYITTLYGGSDRGAYLTQPGKEEHQGILYQLSGGEAHPVSSFYYEVAHDYPGLYVSQSGTVYNWGKRFLARLSGGEWDRTEALLDLNGISIFDLGDHVYFYYDNHLYRGGNDGLRELEPPSWREEAKPEQTRIVGVRWGATGALLVNYGKRDGLFAFDLESCREIPLNAALAAFSSTDLYDAFSLPDGRVWILGIDQEKREGYSFYELDLDGSVKQVLSMRGIPWGNTRCWQYSDCVHIASSGEIIFGLPEDGIAVWDHGETRRYGWQQGFPSEVRNVQEDPEGRIWVPSRNGVACLQLNEKGSLDGGERSASPDWEEFKLVGRSRIWELGKESLAMIRLDHPNQLARWNGRSWSYQHLPFDSAKIGRSMVDDCGHLIIEMISYPDGTYDISPDGIKHFDSIEKLLASATRRGAKHFSQYDGFQSVLVESPDRVWFCYKGYAAVHLIEGDRVDQISMGNDIDSIYQSETGDVLFDMSGDSIFRYDRGQMVPASSSLENVNALLLGDNGFLSYDRALIQQPSYHGYPVLREGSDRYLFFDADQFEAVVAGRINRRDCETVALSRYIERLCPTQQGGAWIEYMQGGGVPARLFAGRCFNLDLSDTPVNGRIIRRAHEDPAGNLWLEPNQRYVYEKSVFMRRQGDVRLLADHIPSTCGRELKIALGSDPERHASELIPVVDVAPEEGVEVHVDGSDVYMQFPRSGDYRITIDGVLMGCRMQGSLKASLKVSETLPDTLRTDGADGRIVVDDPFWVPPVRAEGTDKTTALGLTWSTNQQDRMPLLNNEPCCLAALAPGLHTIEFAAVEDGVWTDESPLLLSIQYAPDYDKAVIQRINDLMTSDPEVRERARRELLQLGSKAEDALRLRSAAAEAEAKLVPVLRSILRQLEREQSTPGTPRFFTVTPLLNE